MLGSQSCTWATFFAETNWKGQACQQIRAGLTLLAAKHKGCFCQFAISFEETIWAGCMPCKCAAPTRHLLGSSSDIVAEKSRMSQDQARAVLSAAQNTNPSCPPILVIFSREKLR